MPLQGQQRALAILFGVFGGGLLIAFLAVSLIDGDDKGKKVSVGPNQPSTSTSSSTTLATLPPTLPPTTVFTPPPTITTTPTVTPGTVIVTPTSPATTKATSPPTTGSTTATTSPPSVSEQIETLLESALLFGEPPPDPPPPSRVEVGFRRNVLVRVTWELDDTLTEEEQKYQARYEATAMLAALQAFSELTDERIVLRATLPDEDGQPTRVIRLVFERSTLDGIDFSTVDPLTIFELADDKDIDPVLEPPPPATTTSSTSTTTTTEP